jgi:hypothetical protein
VLVAVAGVFELGAAFKELEDQLVRFSAHDGGWRGARCEAVGGCANRIILGRAVTWAAGMKDEGTASPAIARI